MVSLKSSRCPFCDTLAIVTLRRFAHSVYMRLLSIDIICLIGNIISLSILYTLYLLFLFPQQVGIFNYYRYKYICYLLHDRACYARRRFHGLVHTIQFHAVQKTHGKGTISAKAFILPTIIIQLLYWFIFNFRDPNFLFIYLFTLYLYIYLYVFFF